MHPSAAPTGSTLATDEPIINTLLAPLAVSGLNRAKIQRVKDRNLQPVLPDGFLERVEVAQVRQPGQVERPKGPSLGQVNAAGLRTTPGRVSDRRRPAFA